MQLPSHARDVVGRVGATNPAGSNHPDPLPSDVAQSGYACCRSYMAHVHVDIFLIMVVYCFPKPFALLSLHTRSQIAYHSAMLRRSQPS